MTEFASIDQAIADIRQGKMVVVLDDANRENEGDLIMAADKITPEAVNFMILNGRGLVCMPMSADYFQRLNISMMVKDNHSKQRTNFGVSIGAADNITTGISAADRATTIQVAANPLSTEKDIVSPGHIFPLRAEKGGVLQRQGHTEAGVDLARLAGCAPAAVICEVINADGTMARLPQLSEFAKTHSLSMITIEDLIKYRMRHEIIVEKMAQSKLPVRNHGLFEIYTFQDKTSGIEHIALVNNAVINNDPLLLRMHSECLTGDVFGSARCDCGSQLDRALDMIAKEGGILLYLRQEGRGIGLSNKIKAYDLQDQGLDTVEANHRLGFPADMRDYGTAAQILKALSINSVRLLTNNPKKVAALDEYGIHIAERIGLETEPTDANLHYLRTKRDKLGHLLGEHQCI